MGTTRAQVCCSSALSTPLWLRSFGGSGFAFSKGRIMGIMVKLTSYTMRKHALLGSCWLGLSSRVWLYQIQVGFVWPFKDFPVGRSHGKGQHPRRTIAETLGESSVSNQSSCMTRDRQWELVIQTEAKGLCAEPPYGIVLPTGIKTTWVRQCYWVRRRKKPLSSSDVGWELLERVKRDLKRAVQPAEPTWQMLPWIAVFVSID